MPKMSVLTLCLSQSIIVFIPIHNSSRTVFQEPGRTQDCREHRGGCWNFIQMFYNRCALTCNLKNKERQTDEQLCFKRELCL